jgi:hypothetical protein
MMKMPVVAHAQQQRAVADLGAAAQPLGQLHVLLRRADEVVDRGHRHEGEADGKEHLVQVRLAVHRPVERALEQRAGQRDDDERERQAGQERHAELLHREHGEIAARHGEGAVREVDEVHQPERHGQADGENEEQHAVGDAVEKNGQHVCCLRLRVRSFWMLLFRAGAQATGYSPPRMSPGASPLLLDFAAGSTRCPAHLDALRWIADQPVLRKRARRWGALRSEIKEEAEGRGTFAEQGTPSA